MKNIKRNIAHSIRVCCTLLMYLILNTFLFILVILMNILLDVFLWVIRKRIILSSKMVSLGSQLMRTKEYIQIFLLLNKYSLKQIERAINKALNFRVYGYDAIRQFLLTTEDYALTTFSLAGREHLRHIVVHQTDVSAYDSLVPGGCHAKRA